MSTVESKTLVDEVLSLDKARELPSALRVLKFSNTHSKEVEKVPTPEFLRFSARFGLGMIHLC